MRIRVAVVGATLVLCGCGRNEEPAGARPARAATVDVGPPQGTSAPLAAPPATRPPADKPRCVEPTPSTPAPKAERAASCPKDPTGNLNLARGHIVFSDAPGQPKVEVELATDPASRERGLMYRTGMPEDDGMLFSWPDERVRSFWMHNTCIPLDMLFIDAQGFIVGVLEQVPTLNDESRANPCPAAHVLELNAGWARAHGIVAGQRIQIQK